MAWGITDDHIRQFLSDDPEELTDEALTALTNFAASVIRFQFVGKVREADLEGLAHDGVESAWRSRHTYRRDAAFTTWLSRVVVRNTSRTRQRTLAKTKCDVSLDAAAATDDEDGWRELQPASPDDTEAVVSTRILWDHAETVLTPRQLAAFKLMLQGYTEQEIGEVLGAAADPANTAKQLIKAARKKLKRIFGIVAEADDPSPGARASKGSTRT